MRRAAADLDALAALDVNFDHPETPAGPGDPRWHADTGRGPRRHRAARAPTVLLRERPEAHAETQNDR